MDGKPDPATGPTAAHSGSWLPPDFRAPDETALLGCVYIDPPEKPGADAEISWWVVDECLGTDLEQALDGFVPRWIAEDWPLVAPRYVGRDLTWDEWLALPDLS